MALFRCVQIPCRLHGFTVYNTVQKGATSGIVSKYIPDEVIHTWVEVYFEGTWYTLEGVIIDKTYLRSLQTKFAGHTGPFCGYGVGVEDFENPPIDWECNDTYIQKSAIGKDFDTYDAPDDFSKQYSQPLSPLKKVAYQYFGRHIMNRNVKRIRKHKR